MVSLRDGGNCPISFYKPRRLLLGPACFHVNAHPLGVPKHHRGAVASTNKLVLTRHVGLAFVVADPGGYPQRVACKGGALVFHVVLPCDAAISQFHKILKGQPQLAGMKRRDGLHPRQINGVIGVLELIKVLCLNSELTHKLWVAVPNVGVGIGE
mgnify:CR=1 FL=1